MANELEIETTRKELTELGDRLHSIVTFSKQFVENAQRPDIDKEWMLSHTSACNYSLLLIRSFLDSIENYKKLPSEQFSFYVGKIAIQHLLETINVFEQHLNKLISINDEIKIIIENRINEKITIIDKCWDSECTGKEKNLKKTLSKQFKNKIFEIAFVREALFSHKVIDAIDLEIWQFAWDIRNSMHRNFTSIKDVNFKYPDIRTGVTYHYKYVKGQELYHPSDFVAFATITEQLSFIMLKVLQKFNHRNKV